MITANALPIAETTDHQPPWESPRTVVQAVEQAIYSDLKNRLAYIQTKSNQSRQSLYIDLWTGQYWIGLNINCPEDCELLKPISADTALSLATRDTYRILNQPSTIQPFTAAH